MTRHIFQLLLLLTIIWIAGCDFASTALAGSDSSETPSNTGPVSRIPRSLLDQWLAPYPSNTQDSLLAGDFAPVAVGAQWEYYRSERYARDTAAVQVMERIMRLSQRIVKVDSFTVGKLLTVLTVAQPVRNRVRYPLGGKSPERDEAVDTAARDSATQLFLERRGGFLVLDSTGSWRAAGIGDEWLYHRVQKSAVLPEAGRYAPEKSISFTVGPTQAKYVTGIGRVSFQAVHASSGSDSQITTITLLAKDGKVYDDSLWADWTRPASPADSSSMAAALMGLRDSLPTGFCTEPSVPSVDTVDDRLGAKYAIRLGSTWEYLYNSTGYSGFKGYRTPTQIAQGLFRLSVTGIASVDSCVLFAMDEFLETDTTTGNSSVIKPDSDKKYNLIGVKRGTTFYLMDRGSEAHELFSKPIGWVYLSSNAESVFWPFPYHTDTLWADSSYQRWSFLNPPSCTTSPELLTGENGNQYSCQNSQTIENVEFRISSSFGLTFYNQVMQFAETRSSKTLNLFRYNGVVVDDAVLARYKKGL